MIRVAQDYVFVCLLFFFLMFCSFCSLRPESPPVN